MGDTRGPVDEGPTLELPSLFRRRKKSAAPEPAPEPVPEQVAGAGEDPGAGGATAAQPDDEPTAVIPEPEPEPEPAPEPQPEPEPSAVVDEVEPEAPGHDQTRIDDGPADADRSASEATALGAARSEQLRPIEPRPAEASEPATPGVPVGERVRTAVPEMAPGTLAAVVGAVVGLAGCVFTWLGLQGCEVVTGAQTCGGPGLLVLGAIVVGQIVLGVALLRMLGVPEPGNLSFLGVGIAVVIALLLLIDYVYEAWMFAAIPVVTALSFAVARWITTKYTDDADDYPVEQHDIR